MEESAISMQMDVKLDIRERKLEFSHMKSWSQYFVKIEAVKCFPCYMRISFFSSPNDRTTDLIVRINIPGLTVQMATSRTKQHSYGLFWKNNRKRCCAYFAFETQLMCERHLRWMKKSIRNLELYRQEMMQLRRASRTPACEIRREMQPLALMAPPLVMVPSALGAAAWDDLGIYQNLDYTGNVMDLQDFLGPLPTVPSDQSGQLSRPQSAPSGGAVGECHRDSAMSGIYEEIRDTGTDQVNSQLSRLSIASGIYEEMRPVSGERSKGVQEEPTTPPPPLPPRRRLNTNEDMEDELNRSLPTPEMDSLKKKRNWLRLDAMFGRKRTTSGDSQGSSSFSKMGQSKKPGLEQEKSGNTSPVAVVHRKNVCRLRFGGNKRNSFSSPDLSRLQIDIEPAKATGDDELAVGNTSYDNLSDGNGSCTSEFYPQHNIDYIELDFGSSEYLNMSIASSSGGLELETENRSSAPDGRRLNISERILEGFNRSANSSTVNLVGMACSASIPETEEPMEETSSVRHESACDKQQNTGGYIEMGAPGTGFNRQKLIEQGDEEKKQTPKSSGDNGSESIYMIMTGGGKHPEPIRSSSTSSSSSSSSGVSSASDRSVISIDSCSVPVKRNSVDDKIPSYYPNEEILRLPPRKTSTDTCSPKVVVAVCPDKSPFYGNCTPVASQSATTLPRTSKSAQRPVAEATQDMQDRVQETFRTPKPVHRRHFTVGRNALEEQPGDCMGSSPESSPKLFPKYATFSRGSSSKAIRSADSVSPLSSGKRFSSMSRFGKIDFTPLRLKINSVLQRQGSGDVFKTP